MKLLARSLTLAGLFALGTTANATVRTYDLAWSGGPFFNGASASGTMVLDDTFVPNPGVYYGPLAGFGIQSLNINVIDPTNGNGTYTESDFFLVSWNTNGATLDLSQPLIGQPTTGNPFGTPGFTGNGGDFGLFSVLDNFGPAGANLAPNATAPFIFTTNGGTGNRMQMTTFSPAAGGSAVPEPGSIALLVGAGVGGLMLKRRRK